MQQTAMLNMRVQNFNLAFSDFLREVDLFIKHLRDRITELEKENEALRKENDELKKGEKKK